MCSRLASSNSETDGSILYGCVLFIAFEWARVCGSCAGRRFMIGFGSNQSVILVFTMVKRRRTAIVSLPRNDNNGSFVPLAMEEETTKSHPDVVPAAACGGEDSAPTSSSSTHIIQVVVGSWSSPGRGGHHPPETAAPAKTTRR